MSLQAAKVLVIGASAGIGRELALCALRRGADVALAARRQDRLETIVAEVGGGHAVALDVCDERSVRAGIEQAAGVLGGLDVVVNCAGFARLGMLADENATDWAEVLQTNLVGPALTAKHAIAHLAGNGVMVFCSSTASERYRWGLGSYGVTKAALNRLVENLRLEHRDVRFVRATIGSTIGTEFGANFDGELLSRAFAEWIVGAQGDTKYMPAGALASVLASLLDTLLAHPDVDIPHVSIEPPGGPLTLPATPDVVTRAFEAASGE